MSVTVGIYTYVNDDRITLPYPTDDARTVNNIKLGGIKRALDDKANLWDDACKTDLRDIFDNEPASKIFIGIGEILLSPSMNPTAFYYFRTSTAPNGKSYISIEHVTRVQNTGLKAFERNRKKELLAKNKTTRVKKSKNEKPVTSDEAILSPIDEIATSTETTAPVTESVIIKKTRKPRKPKTPIESSTIIQNPIITNAEQPKKIRKPRVNKTQPQIDPMFFFIMKFGEAVEAYSNLFPEQKELYNNLKK